MIAAIKSKTSKAFDASGICPILVRRGGLDLVERLVSEYNLAAYRGLYPVFAGANALIGSHRVIGKKGGGNRHLTAPDTLQSIFSTIDARRIIKALTELEAVCKAQKCNIPKVAGCDENIFLFLSTLYDFHSATKHARIPPGTVRVFLLSDISKAFDRVQLDPLLHAIKTVVDVPGIERLLSKIQHLYSIGKVAVTKNGFTIFIDKLGGVFQGDPNSPIIFMVFMEIIRRLLPPEKRPLSSSTRRLKDLDYAWKLTTPTTRSG